eukprot:jgi/Chrpa1/5129/Chrysochromulina_OHIO_Genome00015126-RA
MAFSFVAVALAFSPASNRAPATGRSIAVRMAGDSSVLIIQNKGGGHGEIGYHLALQLAKDKGMPVTILHEGPNKGKPPHNAYGDLDAAGVTVHWCDNLEDSAACLAALGGARFTAVVDNWSKSPEQIKPYAEAAKGWGVTNYAYVSSAGMYTPAKGEKGAIAETCAVKSSEQRQAEELIAAMGLPYSYFRPQYIYGPKQGKSYLSFFFDRLTRGRPVPVPNDGKQSVTMTHAADNAAMIAAAIGNEKAVGEAFNCATTLLITYDELVRKCAGAAGVDCEIAYYDPKGFVKPSDDFKFGFPFRDTPFFVSAEKAKTLLGFEPKHDIAKDIGWYFESNYKASGAMEKAKKLSFEDDDLVLTAKLTAAAK